LDAAGGETSDRSYAGFSDDLDLFLDLDLSSLASSWEDFVEDLARIRTEFEFLRILPKNMCGSIDVQRPAKKMA
jgi:predicted metal-dependent HD superfamily phosphohydrolase